MARTNAELVDHLAHLGIIKSARVAGAMNSVDRRLFCTHDRKAQAYEDGPLPIGFGCTISAPHMHAYCLEWALRHVKDAKDVLDVGSGSGYMVAAFAMLYPNARVLGIEIVPQLVSWSHANVDALDPALRSSGRVTLIEGNGWHSLGGRHFDVIHVGAAAPEVPPELLDALRPGGMMIIPVGPQYGAQNIVEVVKDASGKVSQKPLLGVRYVPLVKERQ